LRGDAAPQPRGGQPLDRRCFQGVGGVLQKPQRVVAGGRVAGPSGVQVQ
jgi:hypothetical protein